MDENTGMAFKRIFFGKSDIGRKRQINEDSFYCSEGDSLCVVADGMGGHSFGEIASKMAVDHVRSYITEHIHSLSFAKESSFAEVAQKITEELQKATVQANESIFNCLKTESSGKKMGTTLVVLYFLKKHVFVINVGDSRGYIFRNKTLQQVTEDHTVINRWLKIGQISEEQAKQYQRTPNSKYVTRALGTRAEIKADITVLRAYHDDIFLLCTDGLTDLVNDEEIGDVLLDGEGSLSRIAKKLISMANGRGGKDNITVVLAHLIDKEVDSGEDTEVFYRKKDEQDTEVFVRKTNGLF